MKSIRKLFELLQHIICTNLGVYNLFLTLRTNYLLNLSKILSFSFLKVHTYSKNYFILDFLLTRNIRKPILQVLYLYTYTKTYTSIVYKLKFNHSFFNIIVSQYYILNVLSYIHCLSLNNAIKKNFQRIHNIQPFFRVFTIITTQFELHRFVK